MSVTAHDLLTLLAARHVNDVFVPECRNGPSQGCEHLRLDAWAMRRSWSNPMTWGYEIKVSRADWMRDNKWQGYLPYCSAFYFVCPHGIIQPSELPGDVGLLVCTKNATGLLTKKKTAVRDTQIPESMYRYLLMARVSVNRYAWNPEESKADRWRAWLDEKIADRKLGLDVSEALRTTIAQRIDEVEKQNHTLTYKIEQLEEVRAVLVRYGWPDSSWTVEQRLADLTAAVPRDLMSAIHGAQDQLARLDERLTALNHEVSENREA